MNVYHVYNLTLNCFFQRLVPGDQTVLGVSRGHVQMAWPLSVSVLQASLGTTVNKVSHNTL